MKHNLLYTALLTLSIISTSKAQNIRTLFKNEILYGKVQKVATTEINVSRTNPDITTIPVRDTTYFDEKGNTTERRGRVIDSYVFKYTTKFDSAGHKLETASDTGKKRLIIKYDKRGNMIQLLQVSKTGKLYCSERHKYDDNHNLIEYSAYLPSGKCFSKKDYLYSDKGFVYEEDDYYNGERLTYILLYTYSNYDDKGNWTSLAIAENSPQGIPESNYIITRQITYYQ
jgi:hypothetical protein